MTNAALTRAIQQAAGTYGTDTVSCVLCTVESVNEDERTCNVVTVNDAAQSTLEGVQLMAGVNDGWLLIPTVGSQVMVIYSGVVMPFVAMYSEIDKITGITGDYGIQIDSNGIAFNGDSFGGLVKIEALVDKINRLESKVDDFVSKYNSHTHPYVDSGSPAVTSPTTTQETPIGTQTTVNDLENTTVTHGSGV